MAEKNIFFGMLIISVVYFSGVQSDVQLVQSDSVVIKPGGSHTLTCKASGFTFNSYAMHWVRQAPGEGLQWVSAINNDGGNTYYEDSVKGRFTISRDNNNNLLKMQMNNVKTEDSGTYYCTKYSSGYSYLDYWGKGTSVLVTSVLPTPPIVYGLVSEVEGVSTVALGCFMTGYVPSPVDLKIKTTTGNAVSTKIFPEVLGTSSTYTSSGQAIVNSIDFMTTSYQCFVEHKATNSQITKDIPKGCASIPLSVQLMQSSCPESDRLGQVQLACHARGLKSEDAQAKWFIDDQEQSVAQSLTMLGSTNNNGISMIFWFNISEGMWNARKEVKCQVKDTKTSKVAEDKIKKCSDSYNCLGINVYLTGPNVEELIVYKKPYVRCRATNIPKSSGYTFSWKYPGANQLDYTIEDPEQNKSGTYSVTSVLAISVEAWNNGVELTCTFTYNELPSPIIVALSKIKGTKITPSIQVIYPSSEELALKETVTVGCLAHRFFPADIYMGWTQNEAEVPKQLYVNTEPTRDIDGQGFFMYSMISVSYENWNEGNQFACVVAHESLPMSITQRTIGKYSGKPTNVNVSITMSDSTLSCH